MENPRAVLIADDGDDIHACVCSVLSPEGYFVRHARHWLTALNFAREIPPRVIVLNYEMPHLELELFLNQVNRLKCKAEVVVIGDTDEKFGAKIAPCGLRYFFPKPLHMPLLLKTIRTLAMKTPQRIGVVEMPLAAKDMFQSQSLAAGN